MTNLTNETFYNLSAKTIDGKEYNFSQLKDKVVLIVNTASKCGFTPQYHELEKLHKELHSEGLVILGFPCGQFNNQELANETDIAQFCSLNYDLTFQMMAKIDVNGSNTHPVFEFLKNRATGIFGSKNIKWNFTKFLINRNAKTIVRYAPLVKPLSLEIGIKSLLEE
jgi:glutathione peroxidase